MVGMRVKNMEMIHHLCSYPFTSAHMCMHTKIIHVRYMHKKKSAPACNFVQMSICTHEYVWREILKPETQRAGPRTWTLENRFAHGCYLNFERLALYGASVCQKAFLYDDVILNKIRMIQFNDVANLPLRRASLRPLLQASSRRHLQSSFHLPFSAVSCIPRGAQRQPAP